MSGEVIKITINENETIMALLNRMLNIKSENNSDVECEFNGNLLTTRDCTNIQEILIKNSSVIFDEYEKERTILLNTDKMQEEVELFKNRGKRYTGEDQNKEQIASEIKEQERKFDQLLSQLDQKNSPEQVYQWLNEISPYINNNDLYLPLGIENIEYNTTANYIVKKLEEKGYTTDLNEINYFSDYFRRLIAYQLADLEQYGFFAYEYADGLRSTNVITDEDYQKAEMAVRNTGEPELDSYQTEVQEEVKETKIIKTLMNMWSTKQETKQDVTTVVNGTEYSTVGCNSIIELYTKYSSSFFEDYEREMANIIADPVIQEAISNVNEKTISQNLAKLEEESLNNNELENKCNILQNTYVDYENPQEVNNWLFQLSSYINKPYINVVNMGDNSFIYRSSDILAKLKNHGYTTEVNEVNSTADFYRKMVAEKMTELEKYHFFVKNYVEELQRQQDNVDIVDDSVNINQEEVLSNVVEEELPVVQEVKIEENNIEEPKASTEVVEQPEPVVEENPQQEVVAETVVLEKPQELIELEEKIKKNSRKIEAINMYRLGRLSQSGKVTQSFSDRKQEIEVKINELKQMPEQIVDTEKEYVEANSKIKAYTDEYDDISIVESAINAYQIATELPENSRILKALEEAHKLPSDSDVKPLLLDAIYKLDSYYRTRAEDKELAETDERVNQLYQTLKTTDEEKDLLEQYHSVLENPTTLAIEVLIQQMLTLPKTSFISVVKEPMYDVLLNIRKEIIEGANYQINRLEAEYHNLEEEEKYRIMKTESKLREIEEDIKKLEAECEQVKENKTNDSDDHDKNGGSGSEEDKPTNVETEEQSEDLGSENPDINQDQEVSNQEEPTNEELPQEETLPGEENKALETDLDENEAFIQKLQSVGQVSVDLERRLDEKDSWMELNTAISLNKLKDDNEVEVQADTKPHLITKIEKASTSLIEKIRNSKAVETVKQVLDAMKKRGEAVIFTTSLVALAIGGALNYEKEDDKIIIDTNQTSKIDLGQNNTEVDQLSQLPSAEQFNIDIENNNQELDYESQEQQETIKTM